MSLSKGKFQVRFKDKLVTINCESSEYYINKIENKLEDIKDCFKDCDKIPMLFELDEGDFSGTEESLNKELLDLKDLVLNLDNRDDLVESMKELKLKKNGKFRKGTVTHVYIVKHYAYYVEDSYGWTVIALVLRALSEDELELVVENRIIS